MPFSSIKWTVLKCTDILIPVQPWDFLAFAKLWPYLVWANIQSILPSCLLFPNPPTSLPARYSWGSEHCSMVFALSGALWIECQYCQAACLSFCRWIPDSNSSLSCLLYFTLSCIWLPFCYALKWIDVIALPQKSISTDLIIYIYIKPPITLLYTHYQLDTKAY